MIFKEKWTPEHDIFYLSHYLVRSNKKKISQGNDLKISCLKLSDVIKIINNHHTFVKMLLSHGNKTFDII